MPWQRYPDWGLLMFLLTLLWLALGGILGLIATAARLQPASWRAQSWPGMCGLGAVIALGSGRVGTWLLGKYFATPLVLWMTFVGLATLPRGLHWLYPRVQNWRSLGLRRSLGN